MKFLGVFLLAFAFIGASEAITATIYNNGNCNGTPVDTLILTLNTCKDMSQGGQSMSSKAVVCNSTYATLNNYGTSTCTGSATPINAVPNVCTSDGSGSWVKVDCADSPSPPPSKSGSSEIFLSFGTILAVFFAMFN